MDLATLCNQRQRLADEFRSTLTCLSMLRTQLIGCSEAHARLRLQSAIDEQSIVARDISERLLALDASILDMQATKFERGQVRSTRWTSNDAALKRIDSPQTREQTARTRTAN